MSDEEQNRRVQQGEVEKNVSGNSREAENVCSALSKEEVKEEVKEEGNMISFSFLFGRDRKSTKNKIRNKREREEGALEVLAARESAEKRAKIVQDGWHRRWRC